MNLLRRFYVVPSSLLATRIRTSSTPYFHGVPFIAARNVVHGRHFRSTSIKLTNTVELTSLFAQILHDFTKGKQEMQQMSERFSEEKSRMLKEANEEKERKIKEATEEKERKIKEVTEEMEKKLKNANEEKERIREESYKVKESMLRSFYEERIKIKKLLDDQRTARMKAENDLLRYEGRLNCKGMLEYIAAEKFPNTRSTTERLRKCVEEQRRVRCCHNTGE
ncbi:hypothetical protein BKA69DRAFT_152795 [Paraphysoderma sedebokerense]|nr:hypothetical protein BKA69DRAFT_152795 [Paraphysoderma sedebokerense]